MKKYQLVISLIIVLGIFLRLYMLGQVPASLNWDEVAIGWNAHTLFHTRLDEYGTRLPLSFMSYGDYKAPFYIYATAPFVGIFGLNAWVVRLPSALSGIALLFVMFFLAIELGKQFKLKANSRKVFVATLVFLISFSPWHLMQSRGAFEANVALLFVSAGVLGFFWGLRNAWWWLISGLSFVASLYAYHSPKVFLLLLLPILICLYFKEIITRIRLQKIAFVLALGLSVLVVFPIIKENISGKGAQRANTSVLVDEQGDFRKFDFVLLSEIGQNFRLELSPAFYTSGSSVNLRNTLRGSGLMPVTAWLFFVLALLVFLLRQKHPKAGLFLLLWYLGGLVPGVLGKGAEVPHPIRSLNSLPAILLLSAFGVVAVWQFTQEIKWPKKIGRILKRYPKAQLSWFLALIAVVYLGRFGEYLHEYYVEFPVYAARDWQYGYEEAVKYAKSKESEVDKIVITSTYGQPHIFTYFYQERDPMEIFWGQMGMYLFREVDWDGDQFMQRTLLVGTHEEIPENIPGNAGKIVKEVYFPDGSVAFRIAQTKGEE